MRKKFVKLISMLTVVALMLPLLFAAASGAAYYDALTLTVNGEEISLSFAIKEENGNVFLPLRETANAAGVSVQYGDSPKRVAVAHGVFEAVFYYTDTNAYYIGSERFKYQNAFLVDEYGSYINADLFCSLFGYTMSENRAESEINLNSYRIDNSYATFSVIPATGFAAGDGGYDSPYQIKTAGQLAYLSANVSSGESYTGKYFEISADIVINNISDYESWGTTGAEKKLKPIGTSDNPFDGIIDGLGHSITGLYIKRTSGYTGLFGVSTGVIKNINLVSAYIDGGSFTGGIVGRGDAEGCDVSGVVKGVNFVGGISGYSYSAISNCKNTAAVTGNDYVGGILGDGDADNCENGGTVSGGSRVGGIVGKGNASYCANAGGVNASGDYAGGVVGYIVASGTTRKNYNTANVVTSGCYAGGVVGYNGKVYHSYNTGSVRAAAYAGGVIGCGSAAYTYNIGDADGGIAAVEIETVTASYDIKTTTDSAMQNPSTYSGWDFSGVWKLDNTYGYLYPSLRENLNIFPIRASSGLSQKCFTNDNGVFVYGIPTYTTEVELLSLFESGRNITVTDDNNNAITGDGIIKTGYLIHMNDKTAALSVRGDADGDGRMTTADAIHILRYAAGWAVPLRADLVDFNRDGRANAKDAVLILRKIAGWNVTVK